MIAVFNAQGSLLSLSHSQVFQGSNKANAIEIIAPISPSAIVQASFTFPNGKITKPVVVPLGINDGFLGFKDENDNLLYRWSWDVVSAITSYIGVVSVHITAEKDTVIIADYSFEFEVLAGSPPTEPPEIDDYAELMNYLETQYTAINNNLNAINNSKWGLKDFIGAFGNLDSLANGCYFASAGVNSNAPVSGYLYCVGYRPKFQVLFGQDSYVYLRYTYFDSSYGDYVWGDWHKGATQFDVNTLQNQITELSNRLNSLVIGGQTDIFLIVNELPEEGYANKIYLVPIADGETPNVFDEYLWVYSHWEYFGRSSLNVDLSEYVKFTDYATTSQFGVVKLGQGIKRDSNNGLLYTDYATKSAIDAKASYYQTIGPKFFDYAWKVSATTNTEEWTDEDKTNACATIGAVKKVDGVYRAYVNDSNGNQTTWSVWYGATNNSVMMRDGNGRSSVKEPTVDENIANKKYVDDLVAECGTWTSVPISEGNIQLENNTSGGTITKYLSDFSIKYNSKLRLLNVTGRVRIDAASGWSGTPTVKVDINYLKAYIGEITTATKFSAVQFTLANNSSQIQQNEGAILIVDNTQFKVVAIETFQNHRDAGKYCFDFNNTIPY